MSILKSFFISNINLQVECKDTRLSERVIGAIEDCFFMTGNSSIRNSPDITLRFKNSNSYIEVPESAHELSSSSSLSILKDGEFYYLISGNSTFRIDLANSLGIGCMDSSFWERPPKSQHEFLMLSILWLLRKHGLYAIHANGVVKDDLGILFMGSTGSGKSTAALSLIRQGWGWLSDDVILLRDYNGQIETLAYLSKFSLDPKLADHYPELSKPMKKSSLNGQKKFLDINPIYPGRFRPRCTPEVIIFPKIVSRDKSLLVQIDRVKALILLIENSGGIMVDKVLVTKQIEILKQLVSQTDSYQLLAGRDLYEEPAKISEVLSGAM